MKTIWIALLLAGIVPMAQAQDKKGEKVIKEEVIKEEIIEIRGQEGDGDGDVLIERRMGPTPEQREHMEAMKIGYLTREMDLTVEESQKFWPIYNEMDKKLEALRKEKRLEMRDSLPDIDKMTDAEANAYVENHMSYRQRELDIHREYLKRFQGVLPPQKIVRLIRAQHEFKEHLIMMIREHRGPGGPQGGKGGGPQWEERRIEHRMAPAPGGRGPRH